MATICKSWEKQVLENTNKIKELEESGGSDVTRYEFNALSSRVSTAEGDIDQLEDDLAIVQNATSRALKTPVVAPASTQLVAVNTGNDQAMISIGSGLSLQNGTLSATGGGGSGSGKYLHVIKFAVYTETYQYGQIMLLLNTNTNFTGTDNENAPTYDQFFDLGMAMSDAGYTTACVLTHGDGFTSLAFRADSSRENYLTVDTSDGETIGNESFSNFVDTVIPL